MGTALRNKGIDAISIMVYVTDNLVFLKTSHNNLLLFLFMAFGLVSFFRAPIVALGDYYADRGGVQCNRLTLETSSVRSMS